MATQPIFDNPVTVDQYLATVFEHDCEYVDGTIEERALGEFEHSFLQGLLCGIFFQNRLEWGVLYLPEQGVRISPTRFRIPDLTVLATGTPRERVLTAPPLLVIEIQSPEDTLRRTTAKVKEYSAFGIRNVWVIDPENRTAFTGSADGLKEVSSGWLEVPGTAIRIAVADLFAEMDRA